METLFSLSSLSVMPFWLLMIALPKWGWTRRVMQSPLVIAIPALLYAALVLPRLPELWPAVAQPKPAGIAALLGTPTGAAIAWMHFLAFDLFVGRWVYLDSRARERSVWLMAPILFLTLLFGPLGFLSYLAVRFAADRLRRAGTSPIETGPQRAAAPPAAGYTGPPAASRAWTGLRRAWQALWATNRPLALTTLLMLLGLVGSLAGLALDPRVITGAPAWLKPAKFFLSTAIYSLTLLWMLTFVTGRARLVGLISWVTAIGFAVELSLIAGAALFGTTSHFNVSTPLHAALWATMALFIVAVWTMCLLTAILLLRQRFSDVAFAGSLRLGVLITCVGMAVAFFMTAPTASQRAGRKYAPPKIVGAHSVGVPDGGPGLPVTNWSTQGGDLRVPHFVGMHALQALPLIGWLLTLPRFRRLGDRRRAALVWTAGLTYLGLVLLLTWQALRGQPVLAPDALTLGVLALLLGVAGVAAMGILGAAARPTDAADRKYSETGAANPS